MKIIAFISNMPILCANGTSGIYCPSTASTCASWEPVAITGIICATILIIAITGISLFFIWKNKEMNAQKQAAAEKRVQEEENRKIEFRARLLEKLLSFKESRTKTENASKLDAGGCKAYEESLKEELKRFDDTSKTKGDVTPPTQN